MLPTFSKTILQELLDRIPKNVSFDLHTGLGPTGNSLRNFKSVITKSNCIFVHHDILCPDEFDHKSQSITSGAQDYLNIIERYPNTKFVIMYGSQHADRELVHDRLQLVRYTSALCYQKDEYQRLTPCNTKNFSNEKTFICLNRHPRQHRINLVSYLLGLNLENFGTISFKDEFYKADQWVDRVSWDLSETQISNIKPILARGFIKTKKLNLLTSIAQVDQIYQDSIDNAANFDINLRTIYENHFIEIVSESLFNKPTVGISEKFLNSVYGYVFPIVIGGQGVVKCLSNLGFDMFEDIIDQSYDSIADPLDRLCAAVDLNKSLLTDTQKIKILWRENQHRFDKNIEFAKTKMHEVIRQQAHNDFSQVVWKL